MHPNDLAVLTLYVNAGGSTTGTNNINDITLWGKELNLTKEQIHESLVSLQQQGYVRDYSGINHAHNAIIVGLTVEGKRLVQDASENAQQ